MLGDIGIIVAAAFYGAIGLAAMSRPHNLLEAFHLAATSVDSRNEIRAVYGGFPLAVAGLLLFTLTGAASSNGILLALAVSSGGMAAGRTLSAAIDKKIGKGPALFAILELIVAGLIAINIQP